MNQVQPVGQCLGVLGGHGSSMLARLDARLVGLSSEDAVQRLGRHSVNALPTPARRPDLSILADQFSALPILLMGASAALSLLTGGIDFFTERQAVGATVSIRLGRMQIPSLKQGAGPAPLAADSRWGMRSLPQN
ncbi:MAG: cation-transporting P-type ATPase, partial [Candidatus Macondimonas sp.]